MNTWRLSPRGNANGPTPHEFVAISGAARSHVGGPAGQGALERYGLTTIVAAPVMVMESATTRVPTVGSPELPANVSGAAAA